MEEKKEKCVAWIKEHKTELVIAGVSIGATIALFLGMKNYAMIEEKLKALKKLVEKVPEGIPSMDVSDNAIEIVANAVKEHSTHASHEVRSHLRNLPAGYKASQEKIAFAAEFGYDLMPGQTWVVAHRTGGNAA